MITTAAKSDGDDTGHVVDSTALAQNLFQSNCPLIKTKIQGRNLLALNCLYLDYKLMHLPHDLAVKTLLLEKTCDLERPFGEKYLVIWTSKRQASQVIAPFLLPIPHKYCDYRHQK